MNKRVFAVVTLVALSFVVIVMYSSHKESKNFSSSVKNAVQSTINKNTNPLSIDAMRAKSYPGSDMVIEQTLTPGANYKQYIASYKSDGLKIYGLLTVPQGEMPKGGWPAIIFNHGYIQPDQYRTTERYVAYVDAFARNGYIVYKSDYRGHGDSQGQPEGAYYSPAYATDVLNAMASVKRLKNPENGSSEIVDVNKIGMWGHSMGGNITFRDLVVDPKDIKVAVIWGGVVGSYDDLMNNWHRRVPFQPPPQQLAFRNRYRDSLIKQYGTPKSNPTFWNALDPNYYISDITAPVQLHTGGDDEEVPVAFSQSLYTKLKTAGKTVEYYNYPGGDHNISSPNFELAIERSVEFFDKYLK